MRGRLPGRAVHDRGRGAGRLRGRRPALHRSAARSAEVLVVDDYGHHPTELAATIAAARLYGRRLVVAFQPHRFTRTRDLLHDFAPALAGADELLLTDVYAAGEAPIAGVDTAALLATFPDGRGAPRVARPAAGGAGRDRRPRRSGAVPGRRRHHRRADGAARAAGGEGAVVSAPQLDRRRAAGRWSSTARRRTAAGSSGGGNRRVQFAQPVGAGVARRAARAGSGASCWSPARCWW